MFKFLFYGPLRQLLTFKNTLAFLFQTFRKTQIQIEQMMAGSSDLATDIRCSKHVFPPTTLRKYSKEPTYSSSLLKPALLLLEQIPARRQGAHQGALR